MSFSPFQQIKWHGKNMWARSCARCGVSKVFFSPSGHQLLNTERCSSFGLSYTSTTVYKLFSVLIAWVTNLTDLSHVFQWFLFSSQHLQAAIMLSCSFYDVAFQGISSEKAVVDQECDLPKLLCTTSSGRTDQCQESCCEGRWVPNSGILNEVTETWQRCMMYLNLDLRVFRIRQEWRYLKN